MRTRLRVLIIEDSQADAKLLEYELRRHGFDLTAERVDTQATLLSALDAQQWDVIVSDYTLPGFSAPDALELVQDRRIDIPFIIVSGTVGEKAAVAAMKAGAHDFFLKDNLGLLAPAIERELREADQRRRHREAEKQLRQAEERFAKAFRSSPVGIAISQPDGRFLDVNDRALTLFGFSREEVIGHTSLELNIWLHLEDRPRVEALLRERPSTGEFEYRTKSGTIRTVLASFDIIALGDEECVLTLFQDITERKQTEAELNTLYNATSYLFKADSLPNLGHQIVEAIVNEFKQVDCGLLLVDTRRNQLVRLARAGEYRVETDAPLHLDGPGLVVEAVRTGRLVYAPAVADASNDVAGETRTRSELVVPLRTGNGVIAVFDLQSTDLDAFSERDQRILTAFAERAAAAIQIMRLYDEIHLHAVELEWRVSQRTAELQRAKEHVETILNTSIDGIILIDADGSIQQANPAFSQMVGFTAEIWGKALQEFIEPSEREKWTATLLMVTQVRQPARVELTCVRRDGTLFDADVALAPLTRDEDDGLQIICNLRDISQRKQLEAELREALEKERELNELKSRFAAMVSHEFRTPLAAILSSSELVRTFRDRMPVERQLDHLEKIGAQVRRLTEMVNDVLTIGSAETRGIAFNPEPLNLETFCRNVVDEIRPTATARDIRFTVNGNCEQADIDPKLMRQVLYNLLSNAVKYSPQGGVVVLELACRQDAATICVTDQGIGIPVADLARLFEVFHRASNVGGIPGTGLGLAIVKRAVEAHRGSISVESEVGSGTTFIVTIPLVPLAGPSE